ncbi:hypothetical protein DENIS_3931 [Desulfonema ishimotonii]|uniref:Pentapeptide repeat-containing protein n=1 Tax=Desulfonema ishimotonii TaxID=45657 RepID=A0A401G171_9BACT|nr:hypothetical protein DENIS_3931 [Desulfonema ishimotonii]
MLRRANFSEAFLKGSRFAPDTDLTHTRWHNAEKTELTLFFGTIMENRKVRALLVSPKPNGEGEDFSGLDLRGAYLAGAKLKNADFRHTNLSKANLSAANITGAKLHGTSRDGWITENMTCDYVYWDEAGTEPGPLKTEYTPDEFEEAVRQFKAGNPDLISRFIEFPPEYHKAGTDILSYFGEILRKKYPDSNAKVRIEQDGLKVKMVIDPGDGNKEVIEEALNKYKLVLTGKMTPEEFTDDKLLVMDLKNQLTFASAQIENQRRMLDFQSAEHKKKDFHIETLLTIISRGLNTTPVNHVTVSPVIEVKAGEITDNSSQKQEENMGDTYNFKAGGDINFARDQAIATINKTIAESGAPDALKTQLEELTQAVQAMIADMPDHRAKRITDKLAEFSDEVSAPQPDRKWYSVSGEGLIDAAKAVGSLGNPVMKLVKAIVDGLPA